MGNEYENDALELLETAIARLLESMDNVDRKSTERTPQRVREMYQELLSGYNQDPANLIRSALFDVSYDEMVIVQDINFHSLCEHHLLPFYGVAHVGYIPNDKIVGLSKIPRVVDAFARRLQVQERLTVQIANSLMTGVGALGVGVIVKGIHMCTVMRGVKKPSTKMVTSAMLGAFRASAKTREEFLANLNLSLSP